MLPLLPRPRMPRSAVALDTRFYTLKHAICSYPASLDFSMLLVTYLTTGTTCLAT